MEVVSLEVGLVGEWESREECCQEPHQSHESASAVPVQPADSEWEDYHKEPVQRDHYITQFSIRTITVVITFR